MTCVVGLKCVARRLCLPLCVRDLFGECCVLERGVVLGLGGVTGVGLFGQGSGLSIVQPFLVLCEEVAGWVDDVELLVVVCGCGVKEGGGRG